MAYAKALKKRWKLFTLWLFLLSTALILAVLAGFWVGSTGLQVFNPLDCLAGRCSLVALLRVWRTLAAAAVGGLLAGAGCLIQSATGNVLAEPSLLGLSSTALLAVGLLVLFNPLALYMPLLLSLVAFAGALLGYTLTLLVSEAAGGGGSTLILAGVAVTAFTTGVAELVCFIVQTRSHEPLLMLLLGSFSYTSLHDALTCCLCLAVAVPACFALFKPLNALAYGDEYAHQLGYSPTLIRRVSSALAALMVGVTVACAGIIGFVGLVSPNMARSLVASSDIRMVLPVSMLIGSLVTLLADISTRLASAVLMTGELPVGVLTALLGGPFFAYLLISRRGA